MICLELFLTFLEIGAVSFGGGYGMIALLRERVLAHGWLTESQILELVAVSESTPGPLAVNMATFVGSSQAGFLGALCATVGVVLPSFFIILLIAALIRGLLRYRGVAAFLGGVRPAVVGLIVATALTVGLSTLFGISSLPGTPTPDYGAIAILVILILTHVVYTRVKKNRPSPIAMILFSAVLGMLVYGAVPAIVSLF